MPGGRRVIPGPFGGAGTLPFGLGRTLPFGLNGTRPLGLGWALPFDLGPVRAPGPTAEIDRSALAAAPIPFNRGPAVGQTDPTAFAGTTTTIPVARPGVDGRTGATADRSTTKSTAERRTGD